MSDRITISKDALKNLIEVGVMLKLKQGEQAPPEHADAPDDAVDLAHELVLSQFLSSVVIEQLNGLAAHLGRPDLARPITRGPGLSFTIHTPLPPA